MSFGGMFYTIFFATISLSKAINITKWGEGQCVSPSPNAVAIENYRVIDSYRENEVMESTAGPTYLYVPFSSRYDLYKSVSLVSGISIDDLTDDDIKRSCLRTTVDDHGVIMIHAFKDKEVTVITAPGQHGGFYWKLKGDTEFRGETWTSLVTEDYSVTITCWINGHRSFSVASKTKMLDKKSLQAIKQHAKSHGFKSRYFHVYNYDNCDQDITFFTQNI